MVLLAEETEIGDLPVTRHHQTVHRSLMEAVEVIRSYYDGWSDS
jgi:hypothetical protein